MGKEWDAPQKMGARDSGFGIRAEKNPTAFPRPGNLGGFADGNKISLARQGEIGARYQDWVREWVSGLIPLLYPGALVFAFGGTRTWHRLACGFEDAGFQMWDTLMWVHGQGFPKAQDMSKLIDGREKPDPQFFTSLRLFLEQSRQQKGLSLAEINQQMGFATTGSGMSGHWFKNISQQTLPTRTQWLKLKAILGFDDSFDRLWDSLACDSERPVIGKHPAPATSIYGSDSPVDVNLTLPAGELSRPWSGHKTAALKPAWEPVLCFKAPTQGKTYAELALEFGSGALNVDGARIGVNPGYRYDADHNGTIFHGEQGARIRQSAEKKGQQFIESTQGRYPANLALECICEEETGVRSQKSEENRQSAIANHQSPDCPAAMLDAQAGESTSGAMKREVSAYKGESVTGLLRGYSGPSNQHGGTGGPSRFFYCAKASRSEREAGLEGWEVSDYGHTPYDKCERCGKQILPDGSGKKCECAEPERRGNRVRNNHPTVKPLTLCRWLATLLLPPDSVKPRRLLVPFCGSGSEMIGALQAGWDQVIGIEQDKHYCEIGRVRLKHWTAQEDPQECLWGAPGRPTSHRLAEIGLEVAGFPVRGATRSRPTSATD